MNMDEEDIQKYKSYLFVVGGLFALGLGMYFSKQGFGFELPEIAWVGWGLGALCSIVQIAFSSQMTYKTNNYVIWVCGIASYIYSGWSNIIGITGLNPKMSIWFAIFLGLFIDWIAEPLIVFGMIGATESAQGDFLRNLLGMRPSAKAKEKSKATSYTRPEPTWAQKVNQEPEYRPLINGRNFAPGNNPKGKNKKYASED